MNTKLPLSISQDFVVSNYGRDSRSLFLTKPDITNLNHGSFGTIPDPVQRACEALTRECEGNPDAFIRGQLFDRFGGARASLSNIIGADQNTCVFVTNVSTAMNTVLHNFNWSCQDHIVHTDAIFESISLAIKNIALAPQTSVFSVGDCISCASILERFREHIKNVKNEMRLREKGSSSKSEESPKIVVIMESITATPSLLLPWRDMVRICHEEKIWSIVDAAHSLGQDKEINLSEVDPDFWMTDCSKWYYTQRGCAVLYVPSRHQGMIQSQLVPGVPYPVRGATPTSFIQKFHWTGLVDPIAILSIEFAIAFRERLGGEKKINDYCHSLAVVGGKLVAKMLGTKVMDLTEDGELTANMTNIELPIPPSLKPSEEIFFLFEDEMMDVHKVFVPPFYYRGRWWARASAQIYNDLSDFERLGNALAKTCQKISKLVEVGE